jgi:hypothetical protein
VGAVVEPGVFVLRDRLEVVGRAAWSREAPADTVAGGAAVTLFASGGRVRLQAGFERRWSRGAGPPASGWAILRASLVL